MKEECNPNNLSNINDHEQFDLLYSKFFACYLTPKNRNSINLASKIKRGSSVSKRITVKQLSSMKLESHEENKNEFLKKKPKYTIDQTTRHYYVWHFIIVLNCLFTTVIYPHYTMNGFPNYQQTEFWVLVGSECIFATNIILNFFKQGIDEEGKSKREPLEVVCASYLHGNFLIDLIAFLPLGYVFSLLDSRLDLFWIIKTLRIG